MIGADNKGTNKIRKSKNAISSGIIQITVKWCAKQKLHSIAFCINAFGARPLNWSRIPHFSNKIIMDQVNNP